MNGHSEDTSEICEGPDSFQSSFARALAQASVRRSNNINNNNQHRCDNQVVATLNQQCVEDNNTETTWQLKEECQRLLEENRRLRATAMLSPLNNDHEQRAEVALLQSRVNTLSWQLSQAESSKRVLRTVSEQVVSFLDRVSTTMVSLEKQRGAPRTGCRVPRSRSTHTVADLPLRENPVSREPREFVPRSSLVHRSGSDVHGDTSSFADFNWRLGRDRGGSPLDEETANPGRLGQQARRLARTLRSLLSTQEPELAVSTTPTPSSLPPSPESESSAINTSFSHLLRSSRRRLSYETQEQRRASFLHELTSDIAETSPILSTRRSRSLSYREETLTSTTISIPNNEPKCTDEMYLTPSLSITSSESSASSNHSSPTRKQDGSADESGFSSLGSFQEIGLPVSYPQNGLPPPNHIRCRSTPINTSKTKHLYSYRSNDNSDLSTLEKLKVLWV